MSKNNTVAAFEDRLDSLKHSVRDLVGLGADRAHDLKERLSDTKDDVRLMATGSVAKMTRMIRARPLLAVGIAFGVGYVAMRIVRR